eukprot:m.357412 g.357412  ORF g.357412 m.357412 type:complete len:415 (+) comp17822_c0_seq1:132-1376(+)
MARGGGGGKGKGGNGSKVKKRGSVTATKRGRGNNVDTFKKVQTSHRSIPRKGMNEATKAKHKRRDARVAEHIRNFRVTLRGDAREVIRPQLEQIKAVAAALEERVRETTGKGHETSNTPTQILQKQKAGGSTVRKDKRNATANSKIRSPAKDVGVSDDDSDVPRLVHGKDSMSTDEVDGSDMEESVDGTTVESDDDEGSEVEEMKVPQVVLPVSKRPVLVSASRVKKFKERMTAKKQQQNRQAGQTQIKIKGRHGMWQFLLQPRTGSYGGQGFAQASVFLGFSDGEWLSQFETLFEEHVEGFAAGQAYKKSVRKDRAKGMAWKQLQMMKQNSSSSSSHGHSGSGINQTERESSLRIQAVSQGNGLHGATPSLSKKKGQQKQPKGGKQKSVTPRRKGFSLEELEQLRKESIGAFA